MIDMSKFSLTMHDKELQDIILPIEQNSKEHKLLAKWAIDCLGRVLSLFKEKYPHEIGVLNTAVSTLESWINDEIKIWDARKYTYTVLELAKTLQLEDKPYAQIVRATSHCLATCHVPTHAEGTAMYVVSAIKLIYKSEEDVINRMELERLWQIDQLKKIMTVELESKG